MPTYVYTTLNPPSPSGASASGINDAGDIVGSDATGGFLYSGGLYTVLNVPSSHYTSATGINQGGAIVGAFEDNNSKRHGFLYAGGIYTTLDDPVATETFAHGINATGQIVGSYRDAAGTIRRSTTPRPCSSAAALAALKPWASTTPARSSVFFRTPAGGIRSDTVREIKYQILHSIRRAASSGPQSQCRACRRQ